VYAVSVKSVNKGHWKKLENRPFMSSCPLYTGSNYKHHL
jgi:hypothetical protein